MGWVIYRIWSTDWIKDQKNEEEKLLNAIECVLNGTVNIEDVPLEDSLHSDVIIEEKIEHTELPNTGFGFEIYQRAIELNTVDEKGRKRGNSDIVFDVISLEQPIHFEELCRRVAPIYGRQKATSVVRNEVEEILYREFDELVIIDESNFIRLKDWDDVKVRKPNPDDDYLRPIAYICDEEIELAMKTIVSHSFGITPEDLFIVVTREFGYKRTSENIVSSLSNVYNKMLEKGDFIELEGKVKLKGE
jgi:hypothetical protein